MRDLESIGENASGFLSQYNRESNVNVYPLDMRCNVLGDIPDPNTIQVQPNDIVTYVWPVHFKVVAIEFITTTVLSGTTRTVPATTILSPVRIMVQGWFTSRRTLQRIAVGLVSHCSLVMQAVINYVWVSMQVKIQEEGEGPEQGTWYVTGKQTERQGK